MLKVLINAYACSPNMGSEPGMAWNWCVNLANYCELHIITEGEFRDKIEAVLPTLAQGKNMHFYYNPVSDEVRKMCWNQGDWRFYKHYRQWQQCTLEIAREIIATTHIDIVHQLNMIGFREPGYLWKIEDIPFVWGPVDAKEAFPTAYLEGADFKSKLFIRLKNFITKLQLCFSTRVHQAAKRASFVVSASSNSKASFRKYFNIDSPLLNETGCRVVSSLSQWNKEKTAFDILWVGKMDFRKQLKLALDSFADASLTNAKLHIVGSGDATAYRSYVEKLGIAEQCVWHGVVSHEEVQQLMQENDVLLFTSVAEGTPHVVLEAIANGLPVVCFNTCGQGDSVNDEIGIKIPMTSPSQSAKDFAAVLKMLSSDREKLNVLSSNCADRARELSWDHKAVQMVKLYKKSLKKNKE